MSARTDCTFSRELPACRRQSPRRLEDLRLSGSSGPGGSRSHLIDCNYPHAILKRALRTRWARPPGFTKASSRARGSIELSNACVVVSSSSW